MPQRVFPGKLVLYRWRVGQVRAGQLDAGAMVTRIHADGTLDLTVHPAMDRDPLYVDRVAQMSDAVLSHCWRFNDDEQRMVELTERLAALETKLAALEPAPTPKKSKTAAG